jgi:hypothetical protein
MNGRFEVLPLGEAQCLIRFRDSNDTVLLASSTIPGFDLAERTIEWLRPALQKDWLYQIGRAYQGNGPMFTLAAPFGVVCSSPGFSSSDAMERAIVQLKSTVSAAPVVKLAAKARMTAPSKTAAAGGAIAPALSRSALKQNQPAGHGESLARQAASREG